jgi:hypothetical protein
MTTKKFRTIIFSDECQFEINGCDGSQRIGRLNGTRYDSGNVIGTKKFGVVG